jgi:hypothetical protein
LMGFTESVSTVLSQSFYRRTPRYTIIDIQGQNNIPAAD